MLSLHYHCICALVMDELGCFVLTLRINDTFLLVNENRPEITSKFLQWRQYLEAEGSEISTGIYFALPLLQV